MTNFTTVTKYMCTVETKNYPVISINPNIQRYSSIKKKLNASEIANCLAAYAVVTLHKNTGANVRLTRFLLNIRMNFLFKKQKRILIFSLKRMLKLLKK